MRHDEGRFLGEGGLRLYHQSWHPDSDPRAVVVLVHGVGEHSGRYMNIVGPLVEDGYAVCSYDQRGHGASEGRRVHIERWTDYRNDLGTYIEMVSAQAPTRPIVVYGHSMGSLVVLDYLLEGSQRPAGAVISGVALEPAGVGSPALIAMARVLTRVTPRMSMDLGIDAGALTRDPAALEAYRADPLVTGRATVRWGTESLDTVARVKKGLGRIEIPLLVVHGESDPLNLVRGARELFDAAPATDKTLRTYPGVHHEPHNDLGHEQVAADVKEWLDHLCGRGSDASRDTV